MVGHGVNEPKNRECIFNMTDKKPVKEITKYWKHRRFANLIRAGVIVPEVEEK